MAKTTGIRKTIEFLVKKMEALEDQSFAQKLVIDELESKMQLAEAAVKQLQENPFGFPATTPYVQTPYPYTPAPQVQTLPAPYTYTHSCTASAPDWAGSVYCTTCGTHMSGPSWTVTSTSDKTTLCLTDPTSNMTPDVEDILELDVSWIVDDDIVK